MAQRYSQPPQYALDRYTQIQTRNTYDEINEAYDDMLYPRRKSTSVRQYQSQPGPRAEERRAQHTSAMPAYRTQARTSEMSAYHTQSRTREQWGKKYSAGYSSIVPPRSTATQTHPAQRNTTRTSTVQSLQVYRQPVTQPEIAVERPRAQATAVSKKQRKRKHWLYYIGLTIFMIVLSWVALTAALNWWQTTQDDWHYGYPRTYQTDAVVGHHDSQANPSHFIALNMKQHLMVIEFPGGDASQARIYTGPTLLGAGQDLTVVTLTFKDVNGDDKPDMILNIKETHITFLNEKGQFYLSAGNNTHS
ncbi:hypothetical protein [Dictyobacter formicarum]|uniref:VCBS repeat-containing protein n=1 Tax=Dictyobacter formicarum TaxID=2778368 RepID=A0ABQ3VW12_9CHLR|nr:hypothetical protein [Dictyobacter formicarum]GHO89901.1 hypothetical protein KSZ_79070 [Dictyobacter formicarum]